MSSRSSPSTEEEEQDEEKQDVPGIQPVQLELLEKGREPAFSGGFLRGGQPVPWAAGREGGASSSGTRV